MESKITNNDIQIETATLGNGCFWCTEAMFGQLKGVIDVKSGYSGGHVDNPDYKTVCEGHTGHAECLQIQFNPEVISYETLLEVFWNTHDPTTLNRQGNDIGTQYRSVIFYRNEEQHSIATAYKAQLDQSGKFKSPIVTEITRFERFYVAEDYHQNYLDLHPENTYCQLVVRPKVEKFQKQYQDKIKK
jgi:methionine-S-sulfoxide reductase